MSFDERPTLAAAALEASGTATLVLDPDDAVLAANEAALRLLGRTDASLQGAPFLRPSGNPGILEIPLDDGGVRTLEVRTKPLPWKGGRLTLVTLRPHDAEAAAPPPGRAAEEARLRDLMEGAQGVFFLSSLDARLLYMSPAMEGILGRSREYILEHENPLEVVHPDDRAGLAALLSDPDRAPYETRYRVVWPDGTIRWIRQRGFPVQDERGRTRRVVGILEDVTEQREEEELLNHTLRLLRRTVSSLREGVLVLDTTDDSRPILSANPAVERIFGHAVDELLGESARVLYPDGDAFERFLAEEARALEDRGLFQTSGPLRRSDGTLFPAEQTVAWLDPEAGAEGGVVFVVRDRSEQQRALAELRASEERFLVLSREISDVLYVLDAQGEVRFTSPSVRHTLGYAPEEFRGSDILSLIHEDDRDRVREQLAFIRARPGEVSRAQYRMLTRDGELIHVESIARNLLDHPSVDGIVVTTRDVTERLALEEQLLQGQKMEAIGRLAGGIAHDFNNLLTVIRAQTDLLLLDLADDDPLRSEVETIQNTGDRAARLTAQLLAFSRDQVLRPRVVDLGEVVAGLGALLDRIIGEDIEVLHDLREGLPAVRVDPGQLEHVVMNLAANARDAMPDGGTLTLATAVEEVGPDGATVPGLAPGRYVALRIGDTGVGMDEATRQRVFEPFFTTKPVGQGTGLGLSMAHGVVLQSGGDIHVESAPGAGTTLTLRFPAASEDAPAEPAEAPPPPMSRKLSGTVLLVEDDPNVRRATRRILERAGMTVRAVGLAEEGLESLQRGDETDLLLTDLVLPGMSGQALVARSREERPNLPVVVVSGYAAPTSDGELGLPAEVAFLKKPFHPTDLVRTLQDALDSAAARRALAGRRAQK